jgi:glycosyltransferase involved in cell wall biosynthesis
MRILGIGRAPVRADEELGRHAAFRRMVSALGAEHEVRRVLTWEGRPPVAEPSTRYVESPPGTLWTAWAVRQEVSAFDPELVVVDGPLPPPARRPAIAVVRDLTWTGWGEVADPRGWLLRRFRRVVVPSALVRGQVHAFGVEPFRVHVIPEPLPDFASVPPPPANELLVLAQIGVIHPAKRPHLVIDAVSRLTGAEKGRLRLLIAGPVRDERYLAQLRVQAEGQPVEFLPDPSAVWGALARANGVVYPTAVDEAWPDAALAALVAGRPVWFSDRPSLRDVLSGLGVPTGEGVERWRQVLRAALHGPLPAVSTAELQARYGRDELRRRWREVVSLASRA